MAVIFLDKDNVSINIYKRGTVFVMSKQHSKTDVILIGGGIMSATLGTLLKELAPEKDIKMFERLSTPAEESSNAWNNAGTGLRL